MGKQWKQWLTLFFWAAKSLDGDCNHEIKRRLLLERKVMTNLDSILKSRDITLSTKVCLVKAMVFPVVMYGCESWTIKKAECRRIGVFEVWCWGRLLRVPWTARRSNQSILVGNQSWIFTGRTYAKAGIPILWPPDVKNWLIWKDSDARKHWGQEEKGTTEDEMVGWHHWIDGHEFKQAPGVGNGQGGLACCDSWGHKESDTTERLNWTELNWCLFRDFTFTFHFYALEKEMATHSSVLAWRIPGTGEPGGLPSMGSHRVRHDWSDLAVALCLLHALSLSLFLLQSGHFILTHIQFYFLFSCTKSTYQINPFSAYLSFFSSRSSIGFKLIVFSSLTNYPLCSLIS